MPCPGRFGVHLLWTFCPAVWIGCGAAPEGAMPLGDEGAEQRDSAAEATALRGADAAGANEDRAPGGDASTGLIHGDSGSSWQSGDPDSSLDQQERDAASHPMDVANPPDAHHPADAASSAADAAAPQGGGRDAAPDVPAPPPVPDEPNTLEEAGLYADFNVRVLAPGTRSYTPAFALWSDGAQKERFIRLPPGTRIDVSDPDHWSFPVGTRLYKTFAVGGRLIETRFLQKTSALTWFRATYAWSEDGARTTRARDGVRDVFGTGYDIPEEAACARCHDGAVDTVLGFEAVSLGNAGAAGLTLAALGSEGLLSAPLLPSYPVPGDAQTAAALGYLHANCGNACHNDSANAEAERTGFFMRLRTGSMRSPSDTDTYRTGVGVVSGFQPAGGPTLLRIAPGDPAQSAVVYRDGTRGTSAQMPPFDSNQVDPVGLAAVEAWIGSLPR